MTDKEKIKHLENTIKVKDERIIELKSEIEDIHLEYIVKIYFDPKKAKRMLDTAYRNDAIMVRYKEEVVTEIYEKLLQEGFINCSFDKFIYPMKDDSFDFIRNEWTGTWKELSCLVLLIKNKSKYAALANGFYKTIDGKQKSISGKDLKSHSEKPGDTFLIDKIVNEYE